MISCMELWPDVSAGLLPTENRNSNCLKTRTVFFLQIFYYLVVFFFGVFKQWLAKTSPLWGSKKPRKMFPKTQHYQNKQQKISFQFKLLDMLDSISVTEQSPEQ